MTWWYFHIIPVFALKGEPVEIACQSPSKSKPSGAKSRAIWLHGDKPVASGGRFQVTSSGNLKVSKPIIKDTGKYTCKTKTTQGVQSQIHHVKGQLIFNITPYCAIKWYFMEYLFTK